MGFLDGLLSPALTVATQAAGAYQGAQTQADIERQKQAIQAVTLQRQQHESEINNALHQAQATLAGANTIKAQRDANTLRLGDPGYAGAMGAVAGAQAMGKLPADLELAVTKGKIDRATAEAIQRMRSNTSIQVANIGQAGEDRRFKPFTFLQSVGADGNPVYATGNGQSGQITPTNVRAKAATGGGVGGGAMAERGAAQIGVARAQAEQANSDMIEIEDGIASGKIHIDPAGFYLAQKAMAAKPGAATAAETALNTSYPDLARYVRAARAISVAERLITPRGGSNAMTAQEAALSGVGPGGDKKQVQQARNYRHALIIGLRSHETGGGASTAPGPASQPGAASQPGNPFADLYTSGGHDD